MIGYDPIGRSAIGELAGGDDVIVFAPAAVAISVVAGGAPSVHGGGSALPPGLTITVVEVAPLVAGGRALMVPAVSVSVSMAAPFVSISATIAPPANDVAVTFGAPSVLAGAGIAAATTELTVEVVAPFVKAGNAVTINVPSVGVVASSQPTDVLGGNYIEASNTVTMITPYGEIGSASIGQFALGEGEPSTRQVKRGVLIRVDAEAPAVLAGNSVFPPSRIVVVKSSPAEIDSRLRRIRIYAIAS